MPDKIISIAAVFCLISTLALADAGKGDLDVVIENVKSGRGIIRVALCSDKEQYYKDEGLFRAAEITPVKGRTEYMFAGIPYGRYAIKVYQDKDEDGKLDTGMFGMPKEPYGFSNNPKVSGGMPSYEKAVFDMAPGNEAVKIRLR